MKKIILTFLLTSFINLGFSQFINTADSTWRTYCKQVYFGFGATQFLGDLGGKDFDGQRAWFEDFDFRATNMELHFGFRYQFHPLFATSTNLYFGRYKASDYNTKGNRRASRKIAIRSVIIELSQRFEFIFYSKYKQKQKEEKMKFKHFEAYIFSGIGLTYFNPQGYYSRYYSNGSWRNLRPLHTEGQGYPNGTKEYSLFTASIPFGFGIQKSLSKRSSFRFECSYMKTFTDYMDDTSGKYFSYSANDITASPEQVYFSNPSEDWSTFKNGDPRGGKGKDCYFFASFSFVKALGMRNKRLKKSEKI